MELAERALVLNPHYPDWYNQGLSYVYFFGGQYGKSVEYRLLVKQPAAIDYAYLGNRLRPVRTDGESGRSGG